MATVKYYELVIGTNLEPDATHHWWWNNASSEAVYAASLDVWRAKYFLTGNPRMEITRVEYRSLFDDFTIDAKEREIHIWVKNTGTVRANYRINLARIKN